MFCRPMAFIMPAAVSTMRGVGLPAMGSPRKALGDEGADAGEGDDLFELDTVAEGPAGGDDGIGEFDAGEGDPHVGASEGLGGMIRL